MAVVPITPQPKRQRQLQPMADPKFLMMAMAMMHNEGRLTPPAQDQSGPSAAYTSTQPQGPLNG